MDNFTPVSGFGGGLLIGLAATVLVLFNGRAAGVSGIVGGALAGGRGDVAWRVTFVIGLVTGPLLYAAVTGIEPAIVLQADFAGLIVAGLLTGFGTQLGGGCTSGHGVCGLARGSARSLFATAAFTLSGVATVYVARHVFGG